MCASLVGQLVNHPCSLIWHMQMKRKECAEEALNDVTWKAEVSGNLWVGSHGAGECGCNCSDCVLGGCVKRVRETEIGFGGAERWCMGHVLLWECGPDFTWWRWSTQGWQQDFHASFTNSNWDPVFRLWRRGGVVFYDTEKSTSVRWSGFF